MLKTRLRSAVKLMGAMALIVQFSFLSEATAGVEGDAELLRLVANSIKVNREMVRTWKGNAQILKSDVKKSGDELTSRATAEFVCDSEREAKRWNFTWGEQYRKKAGVSETGQLDYLKNTLLKDATFFQMRYRGSEKRPYSCVIHDPASPHASLSLYSDDFDPFFFFCGDKQEVSKLLDRYYSRRDSDLTNVTVAREGERIIVTRQMANASYHYEFDPEAGYNLVRSYSKSGEDTWDRMIEYENINGVFVPKKFVLKKEERGKDDPGKDSDYVWEVIFENEIVNEPLSADEFSLAALGLLPGDLISDQRTRTQYRYTGQTLDPNAPPASSIHLDEMAELVTEDLPEDVNDPELAPVVETPLEEPIPEPAAPAPPAPRWPLYAAAAVALFAIVLALIGMKLLRRHG